MKIKSNHVTKMVTKIWIDKYIYKYFMIKKKTDIKIIRNIKTMKIYLIKNIKINQSLK